MTRRILILGFLLAAPTAFAVDNPPSLAQRGIEAYHGGRLDLARLFFERSFRQSALQGRADWAARAACNLADLALETRELDEADRWLDAARDASGSEKVLVQWKRSQLLNLRGHPREALTALDSALALRPSESGQEMRMQLDRQRFLFSVQDSAGWEKGFAKFMGGLRSAQKREALGLSAWARMRRRDYAAAENLWSQAVSAYREQRRMLAMGEALAYRALCLHALQRREEALRLAVQAEGVFQETGYAVGRLRAQALELLLQDSGDVAKSGREVDFLARERLGEDWKDLLEDYAQSYPPLLGRLELLRGR